MQGIAMMDESKSNIIMAVLTLLGSFFVRLRELLECGLAGLSKQEPGRELGKALNKKITDAIQRRVLFFLVLLILMLSFINSVQEAQHDGIAYSPIIKFGKEAKIDRATVFGW